LDYTAFIPVRGGSKSIPLKNIKLFCGKPLIYWTISAAHEIENIKSIVIATDSSEIENVVKSFNFPKVKIYHRKEENAQDTSSTESVMLEYLEGATQENEGFILIQATSPLLVSDDLRNGLKIHQKKDSVLSCVNEKRFFWNTDGTSKNYDYLNRPRRQDFEGDLMENGAFYINSVAKILEGENRLSGDIGISVMANYTAVEIDEPDDWLIAENLMQRHILKNKSKKEIKLFLTDVDGVLTDAGMYYSEYGDEFKKFNTHDGMAFQLLREKGIKTGIITSENTKLVERRAKKLKVDFLIQGKRDGGKLESALEIANKLNIGLDQVAYIGDDINCKQLLESVGFAACPLNATPKIKRIHNIKQLLTKGGEGAVREWVEYLFH